MAGPYETTLAAACALGDIKVTLASASNVGIGQMLRIDDEDFQVTKGYVAGAVIVPVIRAIDGTVASAHPSGARVVFGAASDFAQTDAPQTVVSYPVAGRARVINSYAADGAIALPPEGADALAVLVGTAHTGLTLAAPTKNLDGSKLTILDLTAAAHVVTVTGGLGASAIVTLTFDASGRAMIELTAYDEIWYCPALAGTTTGFDVALS